MAELKLLVFSFTLPLLLLLLAFIFRHKRIFSGICFITGFLWLYVPSTQGFAYGLAEYWQNIPKLSNDEVLQKQPQAIVVLSGAYNRNIVEYPENRTLSISTLSRLRYGAELAKSQQLPILTAGGVFDRAQTVPLATQMADTLAEEFGVSTKWRESRSGTTAQNAQYSAELLAQDKVTSIILVTSALHMPRAVMAFERYGLTVTPAPTNFIRGHIQTFAFKLIPRARSFNLSKTVFHEILGYWVYHFFTLPDTKNP